MQRMRAEAATNEFKVGGFDASNPQLESGFLNNPEPAEPRRILVEKGDSLLGFSNSQHENSFLN
jgi:hypothetical protein